MHPLDPAEQLCRALQESDRGRPAARHFQLRVRRHTFRVYYLPFRLTADGLLLFAVVLLRPLCTPLVRWLIYTYVFSALMRAALCFRPGSEICDRPQHRARLRHCGMGVRSAERVSFSACFEHFWI